jgi:hypothetical protein
MTRGSAANSIGVTQFLRVVPGKAMLNDVCPVSVPTKPRQPPFWEQA